MDPQGTKVQCRRAQQSIAGHPFLSGLPEVLLGSLYVTGDVMWSYFLSQDDLIVHFLKGLYLMVLTASHSSNILGWPKSLCGFFCKMLQNELFGQPNTSCSLVVSIYFACLTQPQLCIRKQPFKALSLFSPERCLYCCLVLFVFAMIARQYPIEQCHKNIKNRIKGPVEMTIW